MEELGWLIVAWLAIYLATGALVGPIVARKLRPYAARNDRESARRLATFFASKPGMVAAVVFWPVVVTTYRLGFFLGSWDWKGDRTQSDRAH